MVVRRLLACLSAVVVGVGGLLVPAQADTGQDPYSRPGVHLLNGRYWKTDCSAYSSTVVRCTTTIYGTKVFQQNGRWFKQNDWVFNNLTYLPSPRTDWAGNQLSMTTSWTASDGRRWRSECDSPATGRGACRQYVWSTIASEVGGKVTQNQLWVFNSLVKFSATGIPWVRDIPAAMPARSDVPAPSAPVDLTPKAPSAPAKPAQPAKPSTVAQEQAVQMARDYLDVLNFSRIGLIDQLEYEGFSTADATFAVDYLRVNWNAQAAATARDYLDFMAFSRQGLIDQLEYEGFTTAQAIYGVNAVGL